MRPALKRQARRLDNGSATRPLHNVPMTVKEAFDVGSLATKCGFPPLRDNVAERD
jgi:amidase